MGGGKRGQFEGIRSSHMMYMYKNGKIIFFLKCNCYFRNLLLTTEFHRQDWILLTILISISSNYIRCHLQHIYNNNFSFI